MLSSTSSSLSMSNIEAIVERLSAERFRSSTRETYHRMWRLFNQFFIRLDCKPKDWEQRLVLFMGFLVDAGLQSTSVKSYASAIRAVLKELKIKLEPENYLITSLTKACRLKNDVVEHRFPIHKGVL